ncbi:MAG: SPOR domain-containing protein [bacterium]
MIKEMIQRQILLFIITTCLIIWACEPVANQQQSKTDSASNGESTQQENTAETPPVDEGTGAGTTVADSQEPLPGAYAVLYGSFGAQQDAEDNIRTLRALRINCYLHKTKDKQYGVLIGPYANYSQANKQMNRLQEREIENLSLYHLGGN